MRRIVWIMALWPGLMGAQEADLMSGAQIEAALTGQKLIYEGGAWQDFRESGRSLYNAGRDSWGYWAVRGDRYCSQWPPSDSWACFDMQRAPDGVTFIGDHGDVTTGVFAE